MDEKLHLDINAKMEQVALLVFPEFNQQLIDNMCRELNSIVELYHSILNENTIYCSGEWSGERFKQDFLMTAVWSIREGKQTELWPNLKKVSGDLIIDCIMDMIESAKTDMSSDEVVAKGLVPKVIGVAAATEILHKYYPKKYPLRKRKSEWALAQFLYSGDVSKVSALSYSEFISQMEFLASISDNLCTSKGLKLPENCRFFFIDKLFVKMAEHQEYCNSYAGQDQLSEI